MDRAELEARAERAVRRGEMTEAVGIYAQLADAFPDDFRLAERAAQLQQSLQPAELAHPPDAPTPGTDTHLRPSTPEEEGERLFAIADYAGAAGAYRRALEEKPDSPLVRERLEELYRLARTAPQSSPTDAVLPADRQRLLQALLDRISSRRRVLPRSVA